MHPEVQVEVLVRALLPAEVLAHGVEPQLVEGLGIIPEQARAAEHGVAHLVAVEVGEREACALARHVVVGRHGVPEAARLANHGQGSVAHGDHLGEATGLKEARHEEQVRAGVHALGERGVELDARAHLTRVLALEVAQRILVLVVSRAEHRHLHAAGEDAVERVGHEVHALLAREARDHRHERAVIADLEPQFLLQCSLARGLTGEVLGRVRGCDRLVGGWVPGVHVDAVHDALQGLATAAQHAVQTLTEGRRLNLCRVGGGDGGDGVRVVECAHHVVDGAIVAAQLARGSGDMRQSQHVVQHLVGELALERHVVDGEDCPNVLVEGETLVELAQEHRGERRLPVVAVQDVAGKALGQVLQALHDGL